MLGRCRPYCADRLSGVGVRASLQVPLIWLPQRPEANSLWLAASSLTFSHAIVACVAAILRAPLWYRCAATGSGSVCMVVWHGSSPSKSFPLAHLLSLGRVTEHQLRTMPEVAASVAAAANVKSCRARCVHDRKADMQGWVCKVAGAGCSSGGEGGALQYQWRWACTAHYA
jgi:hypothetical protein